MWWVRLFKRSKSESNLSSWLLALSLMSNIEIFNDLTMRRFVQNTVFWLNRPSLLVSEQCWFMFQPISVVSLCCAYYCSMPTMTRKNDLICWVYLSENQERIYRDFIQTDDVREVITAEHSSYSLILILGELIPLFWQFSVGRKWQIMSLSPHRWRGIWTLQWSVVTTQMVAPLASANDGTISLCYWCRSETSVQTENLNVTVVGIAD